MHLAVDATGLKVYGEGEWKVRVHGKDKRRVWRKLHLAATQGPARCTLTP
ncbi:MAG: transposase [Rhodobacteraceae bacterium]|nr:transposase [Paracoccaceae bacterium]